jgi:hypothetical protein
MKTQRIISFLLAAPLLTALSALAQTNETKEPEDLPTSIAAARCQYTPTDTACHEAVDSGQPESDSEATESGSDATLAQRPRRMPGPPMRRRPMAYPRPYSSVGMGTGRRTAIGAAIGFGLGAAIGAKAVSRSSATTGTTIKASVLIGGLGALVGAGIGSMPPPFQARNRHRHGPWHDRQADDEDESSDGKQNPEAPATKQPAIAPGS